MKQVRIVGVGKTKIGRLGRSATSLAIEALRRALHDAGMAPPYNSEEMTNASLQECGSALHGLLAVPSLSNPHFMAAHKIATEAGLLPSKKLVVGTLDTGGAGPISAISKAVEMIQREWCETVAIVAADSVLSLPSEEFLKRADGSVLGSQLPSPSIPNGYDRIAQWHMRKYGVEREHFAMIPVIMSHLASKHPDAICREPYTLEQVLSSKPVGKVTNILECARRADGGAALILSSARHFKRSSKNHPAVGGENKKKSLEQCPVVISTGEGSGPLYPPIGNYMQDITPYHFSCERACRFAFERAQLGMADIDFFGLYDCFPICFLRALEAVGICEKGKGQDFISAAYERLRRTGQLQKEEKREDVILSSSAVGISPKNSRPLFPINLHGGLQCFGAPWEVPAIYNVIEAVEQLKGTAGAERQLTPKPRRALCYGNGGIFSASAVAILGDGVYSSNI